VSGYWIHTLPPNPESTGTTPVLTKSTMRLDRWVDHLSMQTNYGEATSQILLARRIGKTRIIAETGAGQHGVATATVCARFGMECVIYMGAEDVRRQALNVFRIEMLGAKVTPPHRTWGFVADKPFTGYPGPFWFEDLEGCRQRGLQRLGNQLVNHTLPSRVRHRTAPLSNNCQGLPEGHQQGNQGANAGPQGEVARCCGCMCWGR